MGDNVDKMSEEEILRHLLDGICPECENEKAEGLPCSTCGFKWADYLYRNWGRSEGDG